MRKSLIIIIVGFIIAVLLVKQFAKAPVFDDPKEKLEFVTKERRNDRLDLIYLELLSDDSLNIDNHYGFITNYFLVGPSARVISEQSIMDVYWNYIDNSESFINDIGFYSLGLIYSMKNDYNNALLYYAQVSNDRLKYLNNSLGRTYSEIGDLNKAEEHFLKEIEVNGNLSGAYSNLINQYNSQRRLDDLYSLLKEKKARKFFPSQLKRFMYLSKFNLLRYFEAVFSQTYQNQSFVGFLGALLVMLAWLFYMRKIDIYEPEKWKYILLIFFLGAIFSELTFLLSDLNSMFTGFNLNGNVINDLFYCIIGIGVIEELVKILPVIIILKYTRAINEPVDYLVYGSVSALGFAFSENLLYFNSYGPQIIMGRALTAVIFHMFLTSLAAYGLMLNKYKSSKKLFSDFIMFFLLASIIHGLYDFWLINQTVSRFGLLSIVILIFCLSAFNTLISNSLSNSEFYDENIHLNKRKLQNYLVYTLSLVLLFQYVAISFKFGHPEGWDSLKSSLLSGGYLIIFISANLGTISIKHRRWKPLQIKLPKFSFNLEHDPTEVINSEFKILPLSKNRDLLKLFPNDGKIVKHETVSGNSDWYLFELDRKRDIIDFCGSHILIKAKSADNPIKSDVKTEVAVFVFLSEDKIEAKEKLREDFLFKGWALIK